MKNDFLPFDHGLIEQEQKRLGDDAQIIRIPPQRRREIKVYDKNMKDISLTACSGSY